MDAVFGWLGRLFDAALLCLPRPVIIRATHGGVAFWFGCWPVEVKPGWRLNWPVFMDLVVFPVVRQTQNLPRQVMTTKDLQPVTVSGMIRFKVQNIKRALVECWDIEQAIIDESLTVVCETIRSRTFKEIVNDWEAVNKELTSEIHKILSESYGVKVQYAHLTDFGWAINLNHSRIGETHLPSAWGAEE